MAYTYNEAVNAISEYTKRFGFPASDEAYMEAGFDLEELFCALDVNGKLKKSIKTNHTKKYAAVNIEVLREMRRRNGQSPKWEFDEMKPYWK